MDGPTSPRIDALTQALQAGQATALSEFWREVGECGTPLIERGADDAAHALVTFVWRGSEATRNVVVLGSIASPGHPAEGQLARLADTDVWYRTYRLRADLRTTYQLAENDSLEPLRGLSGPEAYKQRTADWRPDPLNHTPWHGEKPWASALVLPAVVAQPWSDVRPDVSHGECVLHMFESAILGNERRVYVYTPPGYDGAAAAPHHLLVLFDAGQYVTTVPTPTILDNLVAEQRIPPTVGVFVGNPDQDTRTRELPAHQPFIDFLTDELLPWVRQQHPITTDPSRVVIGGSSFGGLAAAFAALRRPDVFGNVLSQSGSYWWKPEDDEEYEWHARQYAAAERLPLRFYLDVGRLEGQRRRDDDLHPGQIIGNRHMRDVLRAKGYPVHYTEFSGGHEYICWRGTLADGLLTLLARS